MLCVPGGLVFVDDRGRGFVGKHVAQEVAHLFLFHLIDIDVFILDHSRLCPVVLEVVLGSIRPAVDAGFVLPLVVLVPDGEAVLVPDQHLTYFAESCVAAGSECSAFGLGMPNVEGRAGLHIVPHPTECCREEFAKLRLRHVVVLDRKSVAAFIGYVVRWIRYAQICYGSVHEGGDILFVGAVATIQNMVAKQPAVAGLGEGVLPFVSDVRRIIFLDLRLVVEQFAHFRNVKASDGGIVSAIVQILEERGQERNVPIAADLIQRHIQSFFLLFVEVEDDAVHLGIAEMLQYLQALVPSDDHSGALVPENRLYIAEFFYAAFQLFKFGISRLQVFPGVVLGRFQVFDRYFPYFHYTKPHSANFSKPPTMSM